VLDASGAATGRTAPKSEAHRLGLWHRCAHVWIVSPELPDGLGPRLYVQRRAPNKDTWPGCLDVTAAGHLAAGEGPVEGGLRELEEELGLAVAPAELVPLGTRKIEASIPAGTDREFQEVFLLVKDLDLAALRLQTEEVAAVLALGLDGAEALAGGGATDARGPEGIVPVRPSDFVPGEDGYLRRVSRAAREVLAGWEVPPAF